MNLETKITIYKFTPQVFTLTHFPHIFPIRAKNIAVNHYFLWLNVVNKLPLRRNKAY